MARSRHGRMSTATPRCAALRENGASAVLPPAAQLSEGQTGIYLLRRVDANGREERGCTHVRVQLTDGKLVTPPLDPALSEARQDAGGWRLTYLWPRRLAELAVARVELLAQVEGQVEQVVAEPSFDGQSRQLVSTHVPTEQTGSLPSENDFGGRRHECVTLVAMAEPAARDTGHP
jgi:hypothetical protein